MATILLIDVVFETLKVRSEIIKSLGYDCLTTSTVNEAYNLLEQNLPDVLMIELKTLYLSGFNILKAIKDIYPKTAVIIFSGDEKINEAVQVIILRNVKLYSEANNRRIFESSINKSY